MVEGFPPIAGEVPVPARGSVCQPVNLTGGVVKALRPEEEPVLGPVGAPVQSEAAVQPRVGVPGGKAEIPLAPLGVEPQGQGHGLQQGGFASAVFPH